MLSKNPSESQASLPRDAKPGAAAASCAPMNPRDDVEVASPGNPPPNDPASSDRPPGVTDSAPYD